MLMGNDNFRSAIHSCSSRNQAGVICGGKYEVRIEPYDSKVRHSGTVLVRYNSTSPWGTICDKNWDIRDANVVCKMLGFPNAAAAHNKSEFGPFETLPYLLDDVNCNEEESHLAYCISDMFGSSSCAKLPQFPKGGNAGVTCVLPEFQVRLELPTNERTNHKGTVLVKYNTTSQWGTICDESWDIKDANVICRMLGFKNATASHMASEFGVLEEYPIMLDDLECSGNETNLANCRSWRRFGNHDCNNKKQAGVTCFREVCTENTCSGHGKCFHLNDGTTVCACDHGYASKNCGKDAYVKRRLDISATYKVLCQRLDTHSNVLQDVIEYRFLDIEHIIAGNQRSTQLKATVTCMNDVLKVTWPSSLTYTADVSEIPRDDYNAITSKLTGQHNLLQLFLPDNLPPILRPQISSSGFIADLFLSSYCENGNTYSPVYDSCIQK